MSLYFKEAYYSISVVNLIFCFLKFSWGVPNPREQWSPKGTSDNPSIPVKKKRKKKKKRRLNP